MRGRSGTGGPRQGRSYYLDFIEYVYQKNQESAFPAPRELVENIAQELWHEFDDRAQKDGLNAVYDKMREYFRNGTFGMRG